MSKYQDWLEQPYQERGEEIDGEIQVVQYGFVIDCTVQASQVIECTVLGFDDEEEAREALREVVVSHGQRFAGVNVETLDEEQCAELMQRVIAVWIDEDAVIDELQDQLP
jgi:hypothetical protein